MAESKTPSLFDGGIRFQDGSLQTTASASGGGGTVVDVTAGAGLSGGSITYSGTIAIADTAVTPGSYTSADITINSRGQITAASDGAGSGTVTSVTAGTGLSGGTITSTGTIAIAATSVTPGSYTNTNLTVNAEGQITAASNGSGGGSSYPLTFVQYYGFESGGSNSTTYVVTFPQTAASSGNTMFMLVACDGSSTFTAPSGWTIDINQQENLYSRFVLMHKISASDTSATLTSGSAATFSGYFFEISGSHALDQYSAGGVAVQQFLGLPSVTPSAGAALFGAIAYTSAAAALPANLGQVPPSVFLPTWKCEYIQASEAVAGRGMMAILMTTSATNIAITPPYLNFPGMQFYASSGLAYATFSIL